MLRLGSVLVASVLAALLGVLMRREFQTLRYRRTEETYLPLPGRRTWVPVVTAAVATILVARPPAEQWPLLMVMLPLAVAGPWLAAVDLDVRRIPDRVLFPCALAVATATVAAAVITGDLGLVPRAALGSALSLGGYWLLHNLSRGGLGFGDVKLASVLGAAVATVSLPALWWSLMIASLAAAAWALVHRPIGGFAFGPWMLLGAFTAVTLFLRPPATAELGSSRAYGGWP